MAEVEGEDGSKSVPRHAPPEAPGAGPASCARLLRVTRSQIVPFDIDFASTGEKATREGRGANDVEQRLSWTSRTLEVPNPLEHTYEVSHRPPPLAGALSRLLKSRSSIFSLSTVRKEEEEEEEGGS